MNQVTGGNGSIAAAHSGCPSCPHGHEDLFGFKLLSSPLAYMSLIHNLQQRNIAAHMYDMEPRGCSFVGGINESGGGFSNEMKQSRLITYVMSFDGETLHRYATIRSREAVGIIEKHTEALFGKPEIVIRPQGTIDSSKDELEKISFKGLRDLCWRLRRLVRSSGMWRVM